MSISDNIISNDGICSLCDVSRVLFFDVRTRSVKLRMSANSYSVVSISVVDKFYELW